MVSKSNEKNKTIVQPQQPKVVQEIHQRKSSITSSNRKMRPSSKTKDATPIKEEDVEEEFSDDDRFKKQ